MLFIYGCPDLYKIALRFFVCVKTVNIISAEVETFIPIVGALIEEDDSTKSIGPDVRTFHFASLKLRFFF